MIEKEAFDKRMYTLWKPTTIAIGIALALVLSVGVLAMFKAQADTPPLEPGLPSEDGIQPTVIQSDNPQCSDLGNYLPASGDHSLKFDPPTAGTKTSTDGYLTVTVDKVYTDTYPSTNGYTGQFFDWHSDRDVDLVIAKGANGADSYAYDLTTVPGPNRSDAHLHAPINASGSYANLSHMDFCYKVRPDVTKTANTTFKRTYKWTIAKSAVPTDLNLVTGQNSGNNAHYTVTVTKDNGTDGDWAVNGSITVTNPLNSGSIQVDSIDDVVSQGSSNTTVTPGSCDPALPATLGPGESLTCSYSKSLGSGTNGTNKATAHVSSGTIPLANGVGTADVTFGAPTTKVNDSITVNDDYGTPGATDDKSFSFDASGSREYDKAIGPYNTCGDKTETNTATISPATAASGASSASATVTAHVKCQLTVVKDLVPDTDSGKFNLLINGQIKAPNVGDNGTTGPQAFAPGSSISVSETAGNGTSLSDYVSRINCGAADVSGTSTTVSFASNDSDKTCTITNTKKGKVTVKKTTDGVVNPSRDIKFTLTGSGLPSGGVTLTTYGDQDGVLDFGYALVPGSQYTVCENPVPAGFTSFWKLDGTIVSPYNPNATDNPPQDLGVRCFNFSASAGQTRAFDIDNSHPGGEPRTIGYWKNWNKCTGGNQATTAAKNGGAAAGFFIVEDLLPQTIGNFPVTTCQQAVKVLSKQDQSGTNKASDAAYALAAQLLATKFDLAAGAKTCTAVQDAVVSSQNLLVSINFTGSGSYLTKSSTNQTSALNLAATLDKYNNGKLC